MWQAALQSQAADLLPPQLLFELAFFYSEINGVADRYVRYNSFTEAEVLPRLRTGAEAFYPEGSAQLDPIFEEHMTRLDEIRAWMEQSAVWAERLSDQLALVTEEGEQVRVTMPDAKGGETVSGPILHGRQL